MSFHQLLPLHPWLNDGGDSPEQDDDPKTGKNLPEGE